MIWFLKNLVSAFLLPPLSLIVLGVAGVLFLKNHPVLGKSLIISTLILFYILSIPIFAERALQTLEVPTRSNSEINKAQAIVILGGGTYIEAPEYGGHTVSPVWIRACSLWGIFTSAYRKTDISDGR